MLRYKQHAVFAYMAIDTTSSDRSTHIHRHSRYSEGTSTWLLNMRRPQLLLLVLLVTHLAAKANGEVQPPKLSASQVQQCSSLPGLKLLASSNAPTSGTPNKSSDNVAAAAQLWIWGFPLLSMAAAAQTTAVKQGSINKLFNAPALITAQNQKVFDIVAPNSDTLYTSGWLDLTSGAYCGTCTCTCVCSPMQTPCSQGWAWTALTAHWKRHVSLLRLLLSKGVALLNRHHAPSSCTFLTTLFRAGCRPPGAQCS
jgi:hypothetical protein